MFYLVKTPFWLRLLYPGCTWSMNTSEKLIYLTFDDGPHPIITPFVLDELSKYNAKATFFCIGNNVVNHPEVYTRIINEGHSVGNHTYNHVNGWKTNTADYVNDVTKAQEHIDSTLFRPPYGRITRAQLKSLKEKKLSFNTVMWSVLSGDFDMKLSPEQCYKNVIKHSGSGSIIVFHDSEKAFERMSYALPLVLAYFTNKGFHFHKMTN